MTARTRSCAHDNCDINHCLETVNPRLNPSIKPNIKKWEEYSTSTGADNQSFSKAHSKENISQDHHLSAVGNSQHLYGSGQQCHTSMPHFAHVNANLMQQQQATQSSQQQKSPGEEVNLHQKLRRQLSLNPGGYDPRIYRNQQANVKPQKLPQNMVGAHRTVAPTLSGGILHNHISNQWNLHQVSSYTEHCTKFTECTE